MPSGKTHAFMTGMVGAVSVFMPFPNLETALLFSFGCFMGLFVYPDLDVDVGNYGFYLIKTVFGEKLSKVWRFYWFLYAKIIPHRGFISHFPIISTIIRLVYLCFPVYIVLTLYHDISWSWEILYALYGLALVDTIHIVADVITTTIKRKF